MSDKVVLIVPGFGTLAFESESAYRAALELGAKLFPRSRHVGGDVGRDGDEQLVDADQLAEALSLPVTWVEQAAREHRIPSIQAGRWRRFRRSAVERALLANGRHA